MRSVHKFKRLYPIGVLVGASILIWHLFLEPLASWRNETLRRHVEAAEEKLRLLETIARLEGEREALEDHGALESVWRADQESAAVALVQAEIVEIAQRNGVVLRSISPGKSSDLPLVKSIGMRIEGEMTLDRLLRFTLDIEYSDPALVIRSATLRRLKRVGRQTEQPLLYVQMDLSAPAVVEIGGSL